MPKKETLPRHIHKAKEFDQLMANLERYTASGDRKSYDKELQALLERMNESAEQLIGEINNLTHHYAGAVVYLALANQTVDAVRQLSRFLGCRGRFADVLKANIRSVALDLFRVLKNVEKHKEMLDDDEGAGNA